MLRPVALPPVPYAAAARRPAPLGLYICGCAAVRLCPVPPCTTHLEPCARRHEPSTGPRPSPCPKHSPGPSPDPSTDPSSNTAVREPALPVSLLSEIKAQKPPDVANSQPGGEPSPALVLVVPQGRAMTRAADGPGSWPLQLVSRLIRCWVLHP